MPSLPTLAFWEVLILLAGFYGIVIWKISTREIKLNGLFSGDDTSGGEHFSPARVQLITLAVLFAINFLSQVISNPTAFPPVSQEWLLVLGGSSSLYAAGKAQALLFSNLLGGRNR
jgi:hypothetical protein